MRGVDLIRKKRLGQSLTVSEIEQLVSQYVEGTLPDYQMSAFAMAVCLQGMTPEETAELTLAMARSGEQLDLSVLSGIKVDKHSTGGVGDTTTLVLAPLVAAVGVKVAKMSGRGLGHTGGTLDKLESIPGFSTDLSLEQFLAQVQEIGVAVAGQTADLAPADKKLYALRDVTDTVESIPLIASSIMSKKLASGADALVLDVKVGAGAFMKDLASAQELARQMVAIGRAANCQVSAVLTHMDEPLGHAVGNALEVAEAIATLQGKGPADLRELCLVLGSEMLILGGRAKDAAQARILLEDALSDGRALAKFREFVAAQGGNPAVVDHPDLLPTAPFVTCFNATTSGYMMRLDAERVGRIAMGLGAGREHTEDQINPAVGLRVLRKLGDLVQFGEPLVEVHAATSQAAAAALADLAGCVEVGEEKVDTRPLVLDLIRAIHLVARDVHRNWECVDGEVLSEADCNLLERARAARSAAYVPYSHFPVGAALVLHGGEVFTGANVENASFGLTNCAERTALFTAVTSPEYRRGDKIAHLAVVADSPGPVSPCGACRQVMAEFCDPATPVLLANTAGHVRRVTVAELLPLAFAAQQME
ncbi:pyrimidine-nucleoside phosphorylase [Alicyclobacillaceae bacterium I2511]|nr:pyrimidine-nucleoside phosphorylase [Alicyclobacillaceae bacterium I2511]